MDADPVVAGLSDPDPRRRQEALYQALSERRADLVPVIQKCAVNEPSADLAVLAAQVVLSLISAPPDEARERQLRSRLVDPRSLAGLSSLDWEFIVRQGRKSLLAHVFKVMGSSPPSLATTFLEETLQHHDPDVRAWATVPASHFPHETIFVHLLSRISDPDRRVARAAFTAIQAMSSSDRAGSLDRALRSNDQWVVTTAATFLPMLADKALEPSLRRWQNHPQPMIAERAREALRRLEQASQRSEAVRKAAHSLSGSFSSPRDERSKGKPQVVPPWEINPEPIPSKIEHGTSKSDSGRPAVLPTTPASPPTSGHPPAGMIPGMPVPARFPETGPAGPPAPGKKLKISFREKLAQRVEATDSSPSAPHASPSPIARDGQPERLPKAAAPVRPTSLPPELPLDLHLEGEQPSPALPTQPAPSTPLSQPMMPTMPAQAKAPTIPTPPSPPTPATPLTMHAQPTPSAMPTQPPSSPEESLTLSPPVRPLMSAQPPGFTVPPPAPEASLPPSPPLTHSLPPSLPPSVPQSLPSSRQTSPQDFSQSSLSPSSQAPLPLSQPTSPTPQPPLQALQPISPAPQPPPMPVETMDLASVADTLGASSIGSFTLEPPDARNDHGAGAGTPAGTLSFPKTSVIESILQRYPSFLTRPLGKLFSPEKPEEHLRNLRQLLEGLLGFLNFAFLQAYLFYAPRNPRGDQAVKEALKLHLLGPNAPRHLHHFALVIKDVKGNDRIFPFPLARILTDPGDTNPLIILREMYQAVLTPTPEVMESLEGMVEQLGPVLIGFKGMIGNRLIMRMPPGTREPFLDLTGPEAVPLAKAQQPELDLPPGEPIILSSDRSEALGLFPYFTFDGQGLSFGQPDTATFATLLERLSLSDLNG